MRRSRTQFTESRGRFYGIAVVFISAGLLIFLVVFPAVEREAFLASVRTAQGAELEDAVMHLCWIRGGQQGIDAVLEELSPEQEIAVAIAAGKVGCLHHLDGRLRALQFLHTDGEIRSAVAVGNKAIGPALTALESGGPQIQERAAAVLMSMFLDMSGVDRARARTVLEREPESFLELRHRLGMPSATPSPNAADPVLDLGLQLREPELRPPRGAVLFAGGVDPVKRPSEVVEDAAPGKGLDSDLDGSSSLEPAAPEESPKAQPPDMGRDTSPDD